MSSPIRADARRNRAALLDAARIALTGLEPDIRVEEVARRAGLAVGTFYRHFDTREALVEAVFRDRFDQLCDSASDGDLRGFLVRMVDWSQASKGLARALEAVVATGAPVFDDVRHSLERTLDRLMAEGAASGGLRADVSGRTLLRALAGVCAPDAQRIEAVRIIDLLVDGLRFIPA